MSATTNVMVYLPPRRASCHLVSCIAVYIFNRAAKEPRTDILRTGMESLVQILGRSMEGFLKNDPKRSVHSDPFRSIIKCSRPG